jgi:predicted ATP-dependent endonuclease of OLD family
LIASHEDPRRIVPNIICPTLERATGMRLDSFAVSNFRCIQRETLDCDPLTILVGRNGAGKSAFLHALRMFFELASSPTAEDFFNRDQTRQIELEATFTDLTTEETAEFQSSLNGDRLVVQRRFPGGEYFAQSPGCEELEPIREKGRKKAKVVEIAELLKELVDSGRFPGLKPVNKSIDEELTRWEQCNPDRCKPYFRTGIFQGPTNIAGGKMRNRTQFVYVPAVREAEAEASGSSKQSPLGALVAPLVQLVTDKNEAVKAARTALDDQYATYKASMEEAKEKESLEASLTTLLQRYEKDTSAQIQLDLDEKLPVPLPKPRVWLKEDGFEGEVARKGHGLQRLFIFSILELYEKFRAGLVDASNDSTMVLAIEEPELYQHPARSRAIADILSALASSKAQGLRFQVFFTTHSPYFVALERFTSLRRVEKIPRAGTAMETKVRRATLKQVGDSLLKAYGNGDPATEASSLARLKSVLGIRGSEGFFADGIILVEGQEDEAVVAAMSESRGISLDHEGVAIIPTEGKTKMPQLLALYSHLGIPVFAIFDADADKQKDEDAQVKHNMAILNLLGETPTPRPPTTIFKSGIVWHTKLLTDVIAGFGSDRWNDTFTIACEEYSIPPNQALKKYVVIRRTIELLLESKQRCAILEDAWKAIAARFGFEFSEATEPPRVGILANGAGPAGAGIGVGTDTVV